MTSYSNMLCMYVCMYVCTISRRSFCLIFLIVRRKIMYSDILSIVCTVHVLVFTRQNNSFRVWGSHVFLRPGVIPARTHPPYKQYVRPYLERNIVTYEASTNIDNPPQRAPTPTAIGRLLNVAPCHYPGQC